MSRSIVRLPGAENGVPPGDLFDGFATEAEIRAMDANALVGQIWRATDTRNNLKAISSAQSTTGSEYWQQINFVFNSATNGWESPEAIDGSVIQIGRETVVDVINTSGVVITEALPQLLVDTGSVSEANFHDVALARSVDIGDGATFGLSTTAMGITGDTRKGKINKAGYINNVDIIALSAIVGETWSVGEQLFAHGSIFGALTNVRPAVNIVPVCTVRVLGTSGQLFANQCDTRVDASVQPVAFSKYNFTGDEVSAGLIATFYALSLDDIGTVTDVSLTTAPVPDNSTAPFELAGVQRDFITTPFADGTTIVAGERKGQVQVEQAPATGEAKFHFEVYETLPDGTPISSGILGQDYSYLNAGPVTVGDLGVEPIGVYHSKIENKDANEDFISGIFAQIGQEYSVTPGNRIRVHGLAEKVGTQGGAVTYVLYAGADRNSFIETPANITTDTTTNVSNVPGTTASDALDGLYTSKVEWVIPWVPGTYRANTMTRIGNWTTMSNKLTSDYPVPIPDGMPDWSIAPDPTWTTSQLLGDLAFGYEFVADTMFDIQGWRIWIPASSTNQNWTVGLYDYNNPNNPILIGSEEVPPGQAEGWYEVLDDDESARFIVYPGDTYRLVVIAHDETNDIDFTDVWRNIDGGAIPGTGIVTLNTATGPKIFIHKTAAVAGTGTDRSADLIQLGEDDRIRFEEIAQASRYSLYRVIGASVDQGTYIEVPVQLLDEGQSIRNNRDVRTDWTVYGAATNTNYVTVAGGIPTYFPVGNVQGFLTQIIDDVLDPGLTLNNDLFGVDIFGEEYTLSDDWNIVAFSGVSSNGSTSSDSSTEPVSFADLVGYRYQHTNSQSFTLGKASTTSHVRDSTDTYTLSFNGVLTCDIVATQGPGGRDVGFLSSPVWYAVYVIGDSSGVNPTQVIASESFTGPSFASAPGYDIYRLVNFFRRFSSGIVRQTHTSTGGVIRVEWNTDSNDLSFLNAATSSTLVPVTVNDYTPPGTSIMLLGVGPKQGGTNANSGCQLAPNNLGSPNHQCRFFRSGIATTLSMRTTTEISLDTTSSTRRFYWKVLDFSVGTLSLVARGWVVDLTTDWDNL